jgi:hypothetical protein
MIDGPISILSAVIDATKTLFGWSGYEHPASCAEILRKQILFYGEPHTCEIWNVVSPINNGNGAITMKGNGERVFIFLTGTFALGIDQKNRVPDSIQDWSTWLCLQAPSKDGIPHHLYVKQSSPNVSIGPYTKMQMVVIHKGIVEMGGLGFQPLASFKAEAILRSLPFK